MGHYDDLREFNEVYNNMKDITDTIKVNQFYKDGMGRNILITKIIKDAQVFPIKGRVYETGEDVAYTRKGTYYGSQFDPKDLVIEEEQPMELQQDIIEAHGAKWEITHSVSTEDMVKKPNHKILFEDEELGIEINNIQIIASALTHERFIGFILGQIMDYRFRAGKKWDKLEEDIQKADYLMELYHKYKYLTTDWGLVKQQ